MTDLLQIAITGHVFCGVLNVYREVFETRLGSVGQLMRALEMVCIFFSLTVLIMSFQICFDYLAVVENAQRQDLRRCLANQKVMHEWSGTAIEWFVLELIVWISFLFTLFLLMIKSRCSKVGIDNSKQFES